MPETPSLCIRADANAMIGIGHVMRCLALAQAWQERGGRVCFIGAIDAEALRNRLAGEGMDLEPMTADLAGAEDLRRTIEIARSRSASWLVLDGYHFTHEYMMDLQRSGLHLLLIDDLADRNLGDVEVVLNQNAYATESMHAKFHRVPRLLLGSGYTLIRREFLRSRGDKQIEPQGRRVLVTLGGADAGNATALVLQALALVVERQLDIKVVAGAANPHLDSLKAMVSAQMTSHAVEILVNPPDMPGLMKWSDLTITAAGSSCWELCCLGVPLMMVVTAENQRLMPGYFAQHDIAEVFGELNEARVPELAQRTSRLLGDTGRRAQLSAAAARVVDGRGADNAVRFMLGPP